MEFELYRVKKTTMHRNIFLLLITFSLMSSAVAQEHTLELTLEETIEQARQQSPDAQNARHSFRSAYWNYKYYTVPTTCRRSSLLPIPIWTVPSTK